MQKHKKIENSNRIKFYRNFKSKMRSSRDIDIQIVGNMAKEQISKRVFQENKAHQIFWKMNISYPLIQTRTFAYQGVRNVCFSENLTCFVFLEHLFWDWPFCLITNEISYSVKIPMISNTKGRAFLFYLFMKNLLKHDIRNYGRERLRSIRI